MAEMVTAAERTRQAITAIHDGDISGGRQLLAEALSIDEEYELAWLWFAAVADSDGEKKFCLERARAVNPLQEANAALGPLRSVKSEAPPELTALVDPDPPDFVQGMVPELRKARRKRRLRASLIVVAVAAVAVLGLWALRAMSSSPVYLAVVVTGGGSTTSQEIRDTVDWALADWNDSGRTGSHPILVEYFSDGGDPAKAQEIAREISADNRFVGVIGHQISATSEAAGPIYAEAGIPVITSTSTADAVSRNNSWYFRTVFDNEVQGQGMAAYVSTVLGYDRSIVVSTDDSYGVTLHDGYVKAIEESGNTIQGDIVIPAGSAVDADVIDSVASQIQEIPEPGAIILMVDDGDISALGPALEEQGVRPTLIGADGLATRDFFAPLAEQGRAGTVNRALAASPLTRGALTGEAVRFVHDFAGYYGYPASWVAPLTYDAVNVYAEAIQGVDLGAPIAEQRASIRERMDEARDTQTGFQGLTGTVYFNENDCAERPVGMENGRISPNGNLTIESAPTQLSPYSPSAGNSVVQEIVSDNAVRFLGTVYTLQRIVAVGINYNQIEKLNVSAQTYYADFFIWFKYGEGSEDPTDVTFSNAVNPVLGLGEPQRLQTIAGQTYALYRVAGEFKGQFNFRQFPFDTQVLPIYMQHRDLSAAHLSYFPDDDLLDQPQSERLESGVDAGSTIDAIPNWNAENVQFFPSSVGNTSALGDPYFVGGSSGITYSVFSSTVDIKRDVSAFLVKNLLPLLLLTVVVYISLWLPVKDYTARVSMAVTGVLTGAVMLNSVTTSLPAVSYTVAIEWAYYVFIALSASTVVIALIGRSWNDERRLAAIRSLNLFARIYYPTVVVLVGLTYWWLFH